MSKYFAKTRKLYVKAIKNIGLFAAAPVMYGCCVTGENDADFGMGICSSDALRAMLWFSCPCIMATGVLIGEAITLPTALVATLLLGASAPVALAGAAAIDCCTQDDEPSQLQNV